VFRAIGCDRREQEFSARPDPDVLRRRFQVSQDAMWIALKELGLERQPGQPPRSA
jgi:hypothetical protein